MTHFRTTPGAVIGYTRRGPIRLIAGASEPPGDPAPAPTTPPTPAPTSQPQPPTTPPTPGDPAPVTPDEPLGPAGLKALQAEREARRTLEKQVAALAPLQKLAEQLGGTAPAGDGKTDLERLTERLTAHEGELAAERSARWRAEIANEKGLTPAQASRLQGSTREELLADADALLALFPVAQPTGPRTPAPDPSQGARGGGAPDLDAQIDEAKKAGNWRQVIALKNQKMAANAAQQK